MFQSLNGQTDQLWELIVRDNPWRMQPNILDNSFCSQTKFLREILFLRTKATTYILNFWCEVMKAQRPPCFPKWKAPGKFSSTKKLQEEQTLTSTNMLFQLSSAPSFRKTSIMVITKSTSYPWKDTRKIKHLTLKTQPPTPPGWVSVWQQVRLCACLGSLGRVTEALSPWASMIVT